MCRGSPVLASLGSSFFAELLSGGTAPPYPQIACAGLQWESTLFAGCLLLCISVYV